MPPCAPVLAGIRPSRQASCPPGAVEPSAARAENLSGSDIIYQIRNPRVDRSPRPCFSCAAQRAAQRQCQQHFGDGTIGTNFFPWIIFIVRTNKFGNIVGITDTEKWPEMEQATRLFLVKRGISGLVYCLFSLTVCIPGRRPPPAAPPCSTLLPRRAGRRLELDGSSVKTF